ATAIEIAREGGSVVLAGRRKERGEAIIRRIREAGGTGLFIRTDVTSEKDIAHLITQTVREYGRLDGAFNNAGIGNRVGSVDSMTNEAYEQLMNVNLRSVFLCMRYEVAEMKKGGGGAIVNCSSVAGVKGTAGLSIYAAAKHGVVGITKSAAADHGPDKIRINAVLPGCIRTEIADSLPGGEELLKKFVEATILKRHGEPSEVAKPVVFLLSDAASFITGALLAVDGGVAAL
ncbi:MAG TPA: SDR family oxidoreductase, partial [Thermodesulfobacteriota bacterium]|nr:SDR family oxidoreductase [Thermodesulfobacteriota bacterium]